MTREETIHELGEWLEQMVQHGVPSHSAKRKALVTAIGLLSAEAVQGWVPCSERLPKTGDSVLVTYSDGKVGIIRSARPKEWVTYIDSNNLIYLIAWMPLPKPYREDGEV